MIRFSEILDVSEANFVSAQADLEDESEDGVDDYNPMDEAFT